MVSPYLRQTWTVSGVLLNMLGQGMVLSYSSCLLPALRAPDSPIKADLDTASWLASSVGLSCFIGFLLSSFLMDLVGRRLTHGLVVLPGALGWILIYFASNVSTLMTGRVLCGVTAGATVTLGAVVIGEYTSPKNRGMFLNLKTAAVCLGNTTVHILGHYFHWRTVAVYALVPYFIAFAIICTWPESPAWLASKRHFEKSEKSFLWLRGSDDVSKKEFNEMIRAQEERLSLSTKLTFLERITEFLNKFTRKDFLKPLTIILFSTILLETCGRHTFPANAMDIIGEITGNKTQSFFYTLSIDLITTASATFSSVLVKLLKRRTLLFASGSAALIVLMSVCIYLFLASRDVISKDRAWIPLGMFIIYFILANLGCTPIPLALLGEVFPLAHRGAGSAVAGFIMSICLMLALKLTPSMLVNVKVYGTFTIYGTAMGLSLLMLYIMLPETKNKTLQQIEDYFNYGRYKDEKKISGNEEEMIMIIKK